ncbi:DUF3916 domain-containing protein [Photorhabdus hainanensis]|uniref:DUF3916 domain-containing protein n=1 Tax=Photorhabdus hainanensis TaxID=1004166 RepID=UPI001BD2953D|nr:DUF3916 domain-containing protein [Photorhabdus hainanensis]MBS9435041.1 DUF3916 domain-containing protein [Photorhabdus hainanensis]
MSMRRIALSNKKLRGIPRRLRSLKIWSESYRTYFPVITENDYSYGYWNVKIPVHSALVQGKQTNKNIQSTCAQDLIDAAYNIYKAKPDNINNIRITCSIVLPDMFSSELCIFTSEEYFNEHTRNGYSRFGKITLLSERSLCKEWNLRLPDGFSELGILRISEDDEGKPYYSEHWYIGEVN